MKQYRTDDVLSVQLPRLREGWFYRMVIAGGKFTVYAVGTKTGRTQAVLEGSRAAVALAEIQELKCLGAEIEEQ